MNKSALRTAILQQLRAELGRQASAAENSRDEAISEESRAESKWDTHSQEAAYLAQGQSRIVHEIGESIALYGTLPLPDFAPGDVIAVGALVELEAARGGKHAWYFLGPRSGGLELSIDGRDVLVLTPQSPLGRQLLGRRAGDTLAAPGRSAAAAQRIVSVR
ncbi:MAG: GreA/GreB family elongation factor [Opitutaceae bacterium]|nr:GreA/GreB family elongation factor [Opitutaceae bacterium]